VGEGAGRYSHWDRHLLFSTSDGSNPNHNGRTYALFVGSPTPNVVGFGSCHLHAALAGLHARGLVNLLWRELPVTYTPRETLQLIEFHRGRLDVSEQLRDLSVATDREPGGITFGAADVAFLEFGSSIDIAYGQLWLLRGSIAQKLLPPVSAQGPAAETAAQQWLHKGLIRQNEALRRKSAEQMLEFFLGTGLDVALYSDIARNARGSVQTTDEMTDTIGRIGEALGANALCVVSAQNAFTPDGRPLSWPGNFPKQLETACQNLGLPLFHPGRLVAEKGAAFSLEKDLHHFTPQFLHILGEELLAMGSRAIKASSGEGKDGFWALPSSPFRSLADLLASRAHIG
jgi:hypothetical protein